MKTDSFLIERTFNASISTVWEALTEAAKLQQWYFNIESFKAEPGFKFQFLAGSEKKQYLHICEVKEAEVQKTLAYTWAYDNYPGKSCIKFELFSVGTDTRLTLTHTGLETFPKDDPDFAKASFAAGWTQIIGTNLKNFVEQT